MESTERMDEKEEEILRGILRLKKILPEASMILLVANPDKNEVRVFGGPLPNNVCELCWIQNILDSIGHERQIYRSEDVTVN